MASKALLAVRVLRWWAYVVWRVPKDPLPELILRLGDAPGNRRRVPPRRLSRAVDRTLKLGRWKPRCLIVTLVLYRLLREQGEPAEVVIGLPQAATGKRAHSWVEIDGHDIGPAPGRSGHEALARYR